MQMTWNKYLREHEGLYIQAFKNAFNGYSSQCHDIEQKLLNIENYDKLQIHKVSRNKTICLDILNTLVVKEEVTDIDQLKYLQKDMTSFRDNYIVV